MTVNGYIEQLPPTQREALQKLRELIQSQVPKAEETISYGMPAFKQNGILVYYAAFTNHMSLFVMPIHRASPAGPSVLRAQVCRGRHIDYWP